MWATGLEPARLSTPGPKSQLFIPVYRADPRSRGCVLHARRDDEYAGRRVRTPRREAVHLSGALSLATIASPLAAPAWVWVVAVFSLAAFAQAISGFGFSLISIPLLTVVCTRTDAVVSGGMVGFVTQSWMAWHLRREVERDVVRWALPASFLGMPVGILIGHVVNDRAMRIGVGVAVLAAALSISRGWRVTGKPHIVNGLAGLISGVLGTTTGTNGPPLVVALAGRGYTPGVTRATLSSLFFFANIVALGLFALDGSITKRASVIALVGVLPAVIVRGASEGTFRRLDPARYRRIVLGLLTVAGTVAIANALR